MHAVLHEVLRLKSDLWVDIDFNNGCASEVFDFFGLLVTLDCINLWYVSVVVILRLLLAVRDCQVGVNHCFVDCDMTHAVRIVWRLVVIDVEAHSSCFWICKSHCFASGVNV